MKFFKQWVKTNESNTKDKKVGSFKYNDEKFDILEDGNDDSSFGIKGEDGRWWVVAMGEEFDPASLDMTLSEMNKFINDAIELFGNMNYDDDKKVKNSEYSDFFINEFDEDVELDKFYVIAKLECGKYNAKYNYDITNENSNTKNITDLKAGDKVIIKSSGERAKIISKIDDTEYNIKTKSGDERRVNLNSIELIKPFGMSNESVDFNNIEEFVNTLPKSQKRGKYRYELSMITDDNIFYINFKDGLDDDASTMCYDINMELLSSNYHATNNWVSFLDKHKGEGYLWVSANMKEQIDLMREAGEFNQTISESFEIITSLREWMSLKENLTSLDNVPSKISGDLKTVKLTSLDNIHKNISGDINIIYIITRSINRKLEKREFVDLETFNKWAEDFGANHYEIYGPYPNKDVRDEEFESGKPTLVNHKF